MNSDYLDKVMKMLNIQHGSDIYYKKYIYTYVQCNGIDGESELTCISHKQGYPCDYIIIGLLLNQDPGVAVRDRINYKGAYKELKDLITAKYNEVFDEGEAPEKSILRNLLECISVIEVRNTNG